jgi:tRNA A37 methylthiotransferase MiaB
MTKKNIYFNEYNVPTNNSIYFPFSSGLLQAYVQQFPEITANYHFQPFLFVRDKVDDILKKYENPDIVCCSVSVWNFELSLEVAKRVKQKYPKSYIIFGGPHVPLDGALLYEKYPFIDIMVYGEGERIFKDVLIERLEGREPYKTVLRHDAPAKELDIFPSPYTTNVFDEIMKSYPHIEFKAIVETNRSCPFSCSFCFWGQSSLIKKMAYHDMDFIKNEAQWIGSNNIPYVFCADANFGMFKRDIEIANIYSDTKATHSFPEKFRVCYGKNAVETVFQTATILSKADLAKTVTLAIQSNNQEVLDVIQRSNIKQSAYDNLQKRYTEQNIPTYTELILGLPLETKETFVNGIQSILESVINNQIFIYHCQILPNTELADPAYMEKHGIITARIPLAEVHGSYRSGDLVQEFEENIIGTNTMPVPDWKECAVIAWIVQLLHGLKIGFDVTEWLVSNYNVSYMDLYAFLATSNVREFKNFYRIAEEITEGQSRCKIDKRYGNIYYEPEEMAFLNILSTKKRFYRELHAAIVLFLKTQDLPYNREIKHVFNKQADSLPDPNDFADTQELAREIILHGRKSNKLTNDILNRPDAPLIFPFS